MILRRVCRFWNLQRASLTGRCLEQGLLLLNPEVIGVARAHQVPIFSGAMTPTEIFSAYQAGAEVIKVFPAATLGSGYFKELRGPFPEIPLMATGGITVENASDFFVAGATALGVGSSLNLRDETPASIAACQEVARKLLAAKG